MRTNISGLKKKISPSAISLNMKYKRANSSLMAIFKIIGIRTFSGTEKQCDTAADEFIFCCYEVLREVTALSVVPNRRTELTTNYKHRG